VAEAIRQLKEGIAELRGETGASGK
jgi:hypothetical protein